MNQAERLKFLINKLKSEDKRYEKLEIPSRYEEQVRLLRSLMNVRSPGNLDKIFIKVQDDFLEEEKKRKGIVPLASIPILPIKEKEVSTSYEIQFSLWQGDITRLEVDAIVNAANSQMLGCFVPCHGCIDNIIHYSAGLQLREACFTLMKKQGHEEEVGKAKITSAYNLPCKYVIHTVGPSVSGHLTKSLEADLKSCYESCLACAVANDVHSIAFCCISTGEFHFPNERAAEIAIETVKDFLNHHESKLERIIFNVFKEIDYKIYEKLLK